MSTPTERAAITSHPDVSGGRGGADMTATGLLPHLTGTDPQADVGLPSMKVPVFESASDSQPVCDQKLGLVQSAGLLHPVVYAWVFDQQGRLLLRRRSNVDPLAPDTWEASAVGPVKSGETSEEAAARLLHEQLGIAVAGAGFSSSSGGESNMVVKQLVKVSTPHEHQLHLAGGLTEHELAVSFKVVVEVATQQGQGGADQAATTPATAPAGAAQHSAGTGAIGAAQFSGTGGEGITAAAAGGAQTQGAVGGGAPAGASKGPREAVFLEVREWRQQLATSPAAFSPLLKAEAPRLKWFA